MRFKLNIVIEYMENQGLYEETKSSSLNPILMLYVWCIMIDPALRATDHNLGMQIDIDGICQDLLKSLP